MCQISTASVWLVWGKKSIYIYCLNSSDGWQWLSLPDTRSPWLTLLWTRLDGCRSSVCFGPSSVSVRLWRSAEGKGGRCCPLPLIILLGALKRLAPSLLSEFRRVCQPQSDSGRGETWLDIWKSSAPFRGLPLLSPETPRCLRRLQIARLCLKETVSGERDNRGQPQHRYVDS